MDADAMVKYTDRDFRRGVAVDDKARVCSVVKTLRETLLVPLGAAVRSLVRPLAGTLAIAELRQEIARREQADEALARAQSMTRLAHVITGPGGAFESWSETLPRITGIASAHMPRSTREWLRRVHPEDRARFRAAAVEAARQGSRKDVEYRLRSGDGKWIDVRQVIEPIAAPGERSDPTRWFSTLQDVTEQRLVVAAIRDLNADLERRVSERTEALDAVNRELEAFSCTVSHDLRAPVRAIDGFSRILADDYAAEHSPESRRLIQRIRHSAALMSRLIEELLAFSRLGTREVQRSPVPLARMVEAGLEEMRDEIAARKVEMRIGALPVCDANPALVATVFRNLLDNALKYTRPREHALIEVGCLEESGETLVYVRDNGVGFDMRYADQLFGVFKRLHSATEFEGTGVGLATVQRIIQRHGGRVWAESKVGEGATFWFTIPGARS